MALLNDSIKKQLNEVFQGLEREVKLLYFGQGGEADQLTLECEMCSQTHQMVEEVAALSDKLTLEVHDFVKDEVLAQQYGVDKIPAIVPLAEGQKDYGVRLYGIPSGYEFSTLIEDILMVSKGEHRLSEATLAQLGKLDRPVHIQVYTTPT